VVATPVKPREEMLYISIDHCLMQVARRG
jgi:hypothetical protein